MAAASRTVKAALRGAQWACVGVSLYQTAVTVLGHSRPSPVRAPLFEGGPKFGLLVCARNEEAVIGGIAGDLLRQDYPRTHFEVLVIAHNCTDATAHAARSAGARVVELETDVSGKAYPILAGARALGDSFDLIGVFDSDSRVPPGLLANVAAAADGEGCLQVETVPFDADDWLATGYGLGRRARNMFWWRPRERLGLGTTINGTGWFIRRELLAEHLAQPRTLTEDLELTAHLYAAGHRVAYVSSTFVRVDEPHSLGSSLRQRLRWVRGHMGVVWNDWPRLARRAATGDPRALDIAIYMVVPTRMLTRLGVTGAAALSVVRAPGSLPGVVVLPALAGEWGVPAAIAIWERLLPLSLGGLSLAVRHTVLSLLWFPIGLWGLATAGKHEWDATRRSPRGDDDAAPD